MSEEKTGDAGKTDDLKKADSGTTEGGSTSKSDTPEDTTALKNALERVKAERNEVKAQLAQLAKAQEDADKAKRDAEAAALVEQGKFKELADSLKADLDRVKTEAEKATALQAERDAALEAVKATVAAHMTELKIDSATKELLEAKDPVAQLAWLAKHREDLVKRAGGGAGIPKTPGETGSKVLTDDERRKMAVGVRQYGV